MLCGCKLKTALESEVRVMVRVIGWVEVRVRARVNLKLVHSFLVLH